MYFDQRLCFFHQKVESQDQLFQMMTDKMLEAGCVKENYNEGISNREKEYPTAVLDLIAIPHVKSDLIKTSKLLFIRLTDAVDWDSPDGFKVKSVFVILVPEKDAGQKHLEILSKVAVSLLEEDFQSMILSMKTGDELIKYIKENLDGDLL